MSGPAPTRGRNALLTTTAIAIAIATPFVARWEGGRQRDGTAIGYADRLARGLPTACEGITGPGVVVGRVYSARECDTMLATQLRVRIRQIQRCLPDDMTPEALGASLSLAYNIGSANFCRSSASAHFRAGHYAQACDAFLLWNRSAGVVRRGLQNRRAAERALCLRGLASG